MNVSDFLSPAEVNIGIVATTKQELLDELASRAGAVLGVPAERILTELLKRENLGSTGMGGGVAIPHARLPQVSKPFGMLVRLRRPIDFDAVDEEPVDLVFLLLLPETPVGEQLGALACIARKLRDPAITTTLRGARDPAAIYRALVAA
jgi:PTS system nitrogen regulatory IIA component